MAQIGRSLAPSGLAWRWREWVVVRAVAAGAPSAIDLGRGGYCDQRWHWCWRCWRGRDGIRQRRQSLLHAAGGDCGAAQACQVIGMQINHYGDRVACLGPLS
jgi:hypothetical protein